MNTINERALEVDFNNSDEDRAVRLHLPSIQKMIKDIGLELSEGGEILMTDGEIEQVGKLAFRQGIWVAIPVEGSLKRVSSSKRE